MSVATLKPSRARRILLAGPDAVQHLDLELVAADTGRRDLRGDLLDERDVVGAQAEPDGLAPPVQQEAHGETQVAGIDLALVAIGDGLGLVIGALDQADGRVQGHAAG